MLEFDIEETAFQQEELLSECARVRALLVVLGSLLALILIRGIISLTAGQRGESWPFVAVLAVTTAYEFAWLRLVTGAIDSGGRISPLLWRTSVFVESLLPTAFLLLQVHTSAIGPQRTLSSPVVLTYFVFIILSTLHLDPALSRLCGEFSALEYAAVSIYVFLSFPEAAGRDAIVQYGMSAGCSVLLLLGGVSAGAVAGRIRHHVVVALHEADSRARIEHDLGIARSIQQGLLPKAPPQIQGFEIAGWSRPADATGGDYFDWQPLPDGRIAITIADVTGHGIGPALCMSACRAYARAAFIQDPQLRDFLGSMNHLLYGDLPSEKFVTMAAAMLDPDDATLELISAGHGPLVLYIAKEDRFRSYDAQGPPLGLMPSLVYGDSQTFTFAPGDIMVFVTDGFIEWTNSRDEEFGQSRLKAAIRNHRHLAPKEIISELHAALTRFVGGVPQADDLTIVLVKCTKPQLGPCLVLPEK